MRSHYGLFLFIPALVSFFPLPFVKAELAGHRPLSDLRVANCQSISLCLQSGACWDYISEKRVEEMNQ